MVSSEDLALVLSEDSAVIELVVNHCGIVAKPLSLEKKGDMVVEEEARRRGSKAQVLIL